MAKIIVSIGTLSSGGAERVLSILSHSLVKEFDEVVYVTWIKASVFYTIAPQVRLVCVEETAGTNNELKKMLCFRKIIKQESPSILLSFLQPYNIRVLLSTIGLSTTKIISERNDPHADPFYIRLLEKLFYPLADGIVVQTETIRKFYKGSLDSKVSIIPNPVHLKADQVGIALKTKKVKRFISVARLMPQKNHDVLIKAFKKFSNLHPEYKLTIYGEGPQRKNLETLINNLGMTNSIELPGNKKNIIEEIANAEAFLLASSFEGMSNAMIEAMCIGLPCICTKVSGAIDLIENGKNGYLFEIGDEKQLLDYMLCISKGDTEVVNIGVNASRTYKILSEETTSLVWLNYLKSWV